MIKKILALAALALGLLVTPSFAYTQIGVTHAFNTAFQTYSSLSAINIVAYSVTISCSQTISGGQTGTVYLEASQDGSTNWQVIAQAGNTIGGTLVIGLALTNTQTFVLGTAAPVDASTGYWLRLRTSGTATFTYVTGTEYIN